MSGPPSASAASSAADTAQPRSLCSICDGLDAVLRLAAWMAHQPGQLTRSDLAPAEAIEQLKARKDLRYDQIVIAPSDSRGGAPRMLETLVAEALEHAGEVIVLLATGMRVKLPPHPALRVLHGPPFKALLPEPAEVSTTTTESTAEGRRGLFQRLLRRGSAQGEPAEGGNTQADDGHGDSLMPPAIAPLPDLPQGLRALAVQPLAGGCGSTTIAVNLAVEIARMRPELRIMLIDLNVQFGNVATCLSLAPNSQILDAYRSIGKIDADSMALCLQHPLPNLAVFCAPDEILPIDGLTGPEISQLMKVARDRCDLLIVDLPHVISDWSMAVFTSVDRVLAVSTLDVRSAQNAARLRALLPAEMLERERVLHVINRTPRKPGKLWQDARDAFAEGCGRPIFRDLPDGGDAVTEAFNAGHALADEAPGNSLLRALQSLAEDIALRASPRATKEASK